MYPQSIQELIEEFNKFPGIGPKTAERFVFYLLEKNPQELENFVAAIKNLNSIKVCSLCGFISQNNICPICSDKTRDHSIITIVAEPQDLAAVEKTGEYKGVYHILNGLIDQVAGIGPNNLRIEELLARLKNPTTKEAIFALNSTIEGESTLLYITNLIKQDKILASRIKVTRLARGLPLGAELAYADEITLSEALKGRRIINP